MAHPQPSSSTSEIAVRGIPLTRLGPFEYEIPTSYRRDMRVPARVFADPEQLAAIGGDRSLDQLINVTTLPIPGSMGTASFVLVGTDNSAAVSFSSTCHGAGRTMSRGAAKRKVTGHELRKELERRGIVVRCPSNAELAEEAPVAYKDVDRVVDVVHQAGIARKVARLRPLGVVKG